MILGVTGGFGCGKTTAARLFESRGFRRLDSDQLVRERVLTAPNVLAALKERYASGVVAEDGIVNRRRLGDIVFESDIERIWLERLTHPMVFALWREALAGDPVGPWAVEVPLLFEKSLEKWFDFIVCVACAPQQQLARLESRGLNSTVAGQRISKQLPLARKIELSDFVLWNDGSSEFLRAQVDRLADSLAR
jgi:dephospho-CoA kinase